MSLLGLLERRTSKERIADALEKGKMTSILQSAYHEVALANGRLREENDKYREALRKIAERMSDEGTIAREALGK